MAGAGQSNSLLQRDERPLWEQFRAACDAVFAARDAKRKEQVGIKQQGRRELEELCVQLEALAAATDKDDQEIRQAARAAAEQWRKQRGAPDPALRGIETRFKKAQAAVDAMLAERARAQKAAVWTTLAAKEQVCEELDGLVRAGNAAPDSATACAGQMGCAGCAARRMGEENARAPRWRVERTRAIPRRLPDTAQASNVETTDAANDCSSWSLRSASTARPEFQQQRLALQVKQLRDRFKNEATAGANTPAERLLAWCAEPGMADAADRQRLQRIFARVAAKA